MPIYKAPLREYRFLLNELLDFSQYAGLPGFEDAPADLVDAILEEAAKLTEEAVALLPKMRVNAHQLNEIAIKITQIEEQSDQMYDQGRKELFVTHRNSDPMAFIVGIDIYSHLEKVMDRFEDVANRISGIVVEQV